MFSWLVFELRRKNKIHNLIKKPQYNKKSNQKLKTALFLILSFLFCQSIFCQFTWQRTYKSTIGGDEEAYAICEADLNNYFIGGMAAPFFRNLFIIKINEHGDTLWRRTYLEGEIYALAKTSDNGCIYAGVRGSVAIAGRINEIGDTIWNKSFNAINFMDIKQTPDINYIMCGVEYSSDKYNGYICKIDLSGNIIWEHIYESTSRKELLTIEIDQNGGFITGGGNFYGGILNANITKINDTGNVEWEKEYFLSNSCYCSSIVQINSGYIATGRNSSYAYLIKLDNNGDTVKLKNIINTNNG